MALEGQQSDERQQQLRDQHDSDEEDDGFDLGNVFAASLLFLTPSTASFLRDSRGYHLTRTHIASAGGRTASDTAAGRCRLYESAWGRASHQSRQ